MKRLLIVGLGVVFLLSALGGSYAQDKEKDSLKEAVKKITAAAPDKATAKPGGSRNLLLFKKSRNLLVFNLTRGFKHGSIPIGAEAMKILGEKTGAFKVVVSDDISMFEPKNLKKFDAVCFNNTTGELFLPEGFDKLSAQEQEAAKKREAELKNSLLDFVSSGKGIFGIHAATDCFYNWPEFGALMGGYFDGHPWNEDVTIKVDDPSHPVNAAFEGKDLVVADEIYQLKEPYSRDNLRVLLSLNTSKTNMDKGAAIHRNDNDFAVSWVRAYGKGRVAYCSLGHRDEIFWNAAVLRHYLDAIQFAMGDLQGDTTPSSKVLKEGWKDLCNGVDLTGWNCKPGSWVVVDGVLERKGGGDIWTAEQFGDFTLDLDFKVDKGANSGVFFRTADIKDCVQTGIEMQVLDSYEHNPPTRHDCGAIYDCLAPSKAPYKAPGEWNHCTLTAKANKINVELNGEKIIDMDLDQWTTVHKNPDGSENKYRTAYKDTARIGYIGFQDHGANVWYKNVKIKPLQ